MDRTHYKFERTLVIVKPDGVQRTLVGEIIRRYEQVGLKIVGIKMIVPTAEQVRTHYTLDPEWIAKAGQKSIDSMKSQGLESLLDTQDPVEMGERILAGLIGYFGSGPVVLLALQGAHAVDVVRKITGTTEPRTSDIGTIRGDFMLDSYPMANGDGRAIRNIVHASGTIDEAKLELAHWFDAKELINYRLIQEEIMYDVNLDGILE